MQLNSQVGSYRCPKGPEKVFDCYSLPAVIGEAPSTSLDQGASGLQVDNQAQEAFILSVE